MSCSGRDGRGSEGCGRGGGEPVEGGGGDRRHLLPPERVQEAILQPLAPGQAAGPHVRGAEGEQEADFREGGDNAGVARTGDRLGQGASPIW